MTYFGKVELSHSAIPPNNKPMTSKEALQIVTNAGYAFNGTRKDHEIIAQALDTLSKLIPTEPVVQAEPAVTEVVKS